MGHINFDKKSGRKAGWKGFYLALALCLVAVGGVAVVTFMNTPGLSTKGNKSSGSPTASTTAPSRPVGQVVTNVPDDRRTTTTTPTTTTTAAPTVDTGAATGAPADLFVLPLTNEVTKGYSDGKPAYSETMNDWRVHNGVDFKGETGQTVKALADGTILKVEEDALWGKVVTIDHGFGIHSRYCGLDVGGRKAGQKVKVGEAIGMLTDIPCERDEGSHLHLEILVNDDYVNPVEAIGRDVKTAATTAG